MCFTKYYQVIKFTSLTSFLIIFDKMEPETSDQYGFLKSTTSNSAISEEDAQLKLLRENARTEKWNEMLKDFETHFKNKSSKLKSRTRKGIPDCLRGYIWQVLADVSSIKLSSQDDQVYQKLKTQESINDEMENVIFRDINRTFPKNVFFKEKYGQGQKMLFNVLRTYSSFNKKTGYVQGMGFIAALFLTYMDEEQAFWMLHSLMTKYNLSGYYEDNFPGLIKSFFILLSLMKKHLPQVYNLFKKYEIIPSMYASQWFIAIFTNCFEFKILVRFFDVFLLEGEKVLYRFALATLKLSESKLISQRNFEGILGIFKNIFVGIDEESIMGIAFGFDIYRSEIKKFGLEYESLKAKSKEESLLHEVFKQANF